MKLLFIPDFRRKFILTDYLIDFKLTRSVQFKTLVVKIGKFPIMYPDRLEPLPSLNTIIPPTLPHYIIS